MVAGAHFCVRTFTGLGCLVDQSNMGSQIRSSLNYSSSSFRFSFQLGHRKYRRSKILVSCNTYRSFGEKSNGAREPDRDYLEAFVLLSETIRHYRMHMQGFQEESMWQSSTQFSSFSHPKESRADVSSIGPAFLSRFQSPTIFLKISCDGDFLLPIIVGEFAVEKLIESASEDESWDFPNLFQLVGNLTETLGYSVTMVKITERVLNTYFARIFFCKAGENDILSVDAHPSDAINVAKRCRVPIYVHKQVVLTDGIRIGYSMSRTRDIKSFYDVSLDSAADGPDLLTEELDLVRNMNLAVKEERYSDAAMWRDKIMKLHKSRREH